MSAWEENVRRVTPYTPGDQPNRPKMIKLNTNENPYPPAPGVTRALKEFRTDQLRLYPDPKSSILVDALAEYCHVKPEQVFVGVGSDDVLALAFMTFFNSDRPVLFPDITYSFYPVWAEEFRIPFETPALDEEFRIRKEDYYRENGGVIFPNPNAPTSLALGRSDVVIFTGGLGPTEDDLTKEVCAEVMGFALKEDSHTKKRIEEYLKNSVFKVIPDNNWKQAMVPQGAQVLDNDNGTAPGLIMEKNGKPIATIIFALPRQHRKKM